MARRIGIFGGSFDPVHAGHIHAAREARRRLGLDHLLLVPARAQPLKQGREAAPAADRVAMLKLALAEAGDPALGLSEVEVERPGPSYTVDTLAALQRELGEGVELTFVAGSDVLDSLPRWHRIDEALALARFAIVSRPGHRLEVPAALRGRVDGIEIDQLDASASEVRERLRSAEPLGDLLAPAVEAYIRARGLYGAVAPRGRNEKQAG